MNDEWKLLFAKAAEMLKQSGLHKHNWTFGGGTALMLEYNHRQSHDIDIFIKDPQLLNYLSPRVNDACDDTLIDYGETNKVVRLYFKEGEVDFIAAPPITTAQPSYREICGSNVYVDVPVEIIAKKIHFRGDEFTARDYFDLAIVYNSNPDTLLKFCSSFKNNIEHLSNILNELDKGELLKSGLASLNLLPGANNVTGREAQICRQFINAVNKKLGREQKYNLQKVNKLAHDL